MVDLSGLLSLLQEIALAVGGVLATALVAFLVVWVKRKTGIEIDAAARQVIEGALQRAVEYGVQVAREKLGNHATAVEIRSEVLRAALDYAVKAAPDSLKHFGITPERIRDMLMARLSVFESERAAARGFVPPR